MPFSIYNVVINGIADPVVSTNGFAVDMQGLLKRHFFARRVTSVCECRSCLPEGHGGYKVIVSGFKHLFGMYDGEVVVVDCDKCDVVERIKGSVSYIRDEYVVAYLERGNNGRLLLERDGRLFVYDIPSNINEIRGSKGIVFLLGKRRGYVIVNDKVFDVIGNNVMKRLRPLGFYEETIYLYDPTAGKVYSYKNGVFEATAHCRKPIILRSVKGYTIFCEERRAFLGGHVDSVAIEAVNLLIEGFSVNGLSHVIPPLSSTRYVVMLPFILLIWDRSIDVLDLSTESEIIIDDSGETVIRTQDRLWRAKSAPVLKQWRRYIRDNRGRHDSDVRILYVTDISLTNPIDGCVAIAHGCVKRFTEVSLLCNTMKALKICQCSECTYMECKPGLNTFAINAGSCKGRLSILDADTGISLKEADSSILYLSVNLTPLHIGLKNPRNIVIYLSVNPKIGNVSVEFEANTIGACELQSCNLENNCLRIEMDPSGSCLLQLYIEGYYVVIDLTSFVTKMINEKMGYIERYYYDPISGLLRLVIREGPVIVYHDGSRIMHPPEGSLRVDSVITVVDRSGLNRLDLELIEKPIVKTIMLGENIVIEPKCNRECLLLFVGRRITKSRRIEIMLEEALEGATIYISSVGGLWMANLDAKILVSHAVRSAIDLSRKILSIG